MFELTCQIDGCNDIADPDFPVLELCTPHRNQQKAYDQMERLQNALPPRYRGADIASLNTVLATRIQSALSNRGGLYLHGSAGTGKTYAVAAILLDACTNDRLSGARWENVPELLERIRRSFNAPTQSENFDDLADTPQLLVLDDLGAEKPSDWVRERLYTIINRRYEHCRPTIVTSNLTIDQLAKQVGSRVASRLCELCEVVELQGTDRRKTKGVSA